MELCSTFLHFDIFGAILGMVKFLKNHDQEMVILETNVDTNFNSLEEYKIVTNFNNCLVTRLFLISAVNDIALQRLSLLFRATSSCWLEVVVWSKSELNDLCTKSELNDLGPQNLS